MQQFSLESVAGFCSLELTEASRLYTQFVTLISKVFKLERAACLSGLKHGTTTATKQIVMLSS